MYALFFLSGLQIPYLALYCIDALFISQISSFFPLVYVRAEPFFATSQDAYLWQIFIVSNTNDTPGLNDVPTDLQERLRALSVGDFVEHKMTVGYKLLTAGEYGINNWRLKNSENLWWFYNIGVFKNLWWFYNIGIYNSGLSDPAECVLAHLLPEGLTVQTAFETVGHIAHVNLKYVQTVVTQYTSYIPYQLSKRSLYLICTDETADVLCRKECLPYQKLIGEILLEVKLKVISLSYIVYKLDNNR